jgi:Arf-GAP/SH3 domain/ANK repeat/PH domain-containing protein
VSFYQLGSSQLQPSAASLARDAANLTKDKQRGFMPSILQNETYGAILSGSPPPSQPAAPSTTSAPPLPPRNVGKGMQFWGSFQMHRGVGFGLWEVYSFFIPN